MYPLKTVQKIHKDTCIFGKNKRCKKYMYMLACLLAGWLACLLAGLLACWLAGWLAGLIACLLACVHACVLACLLASLLACLLAVGTKITGCPPACLLAALLGCSVAQLLNCSVACWLAWDACLLACVRACVLACLLACLPACLPACLLALLACLACLPCLLACWLAGLLACLPACPCLLPSLMVRGWSGEKNPGEGGREKKKETVKIRYPSCEDPTRISTRSSLKDPCRIMQAPLKEKFSRSRHAHEHLSKAIICKNLQQE